MCRHSVDVFQPPSRAASDNNTPEMPTDTTLPNIVRPMYNDLRSTDETAEAGDDDAELDGSASQSQVNKHSVLTVRLTK